MSASEGMLARGANKAQRLSLESEIRPSLWCADACNLGASPSFCRCSYPSYHVLVYQYVHVLASRP